MEKKTWQKSRFKKLIFPKTKYLFDFVTENGKNVTSKKLLSTKTIFKDFGAENGKKNMISEKVFAIVLKEKIFSPRKKQIIAAVILINRL